MRYDRNGTKSTMEKRKTKTKIKWLFNWRVVNVNAELQNFKIPILPNQ